MVLPSAATLTFRVVQRSAPHAASVTAPDHAQSGTIILIYPHDSSHESQWGVLTEPVSGSNNEEWFFSTMSREEAALEIEARLLANVPNCEMSPKLRASIDDFLRQCREAQGSAQ